MKGNDRIIATLNALLADELTAIHQYMVHSEMCENWGYEKLHKAIAHFAHRERSDRSIMNSQIGHRERSEATLGVR
jgi:bacterioferritin (cytochrome b1)